jgi:RNA polymerase sigma-70 factor (ECF subfamily)
MPSSPCVSNEHAALFALATSRTPYPNATGQSFDRPAQDHTIACERGVLHISVLLCQLYAVKLLQKMFKGLGMSVDDDQLQLEKVAQGDRQAIGVLYQRHHKRVFHFIRRFVTDPQLAEDLANDVFIEVWQKAPTFEGRSKVSSWLLGVARYKALSELRKRKPVHSKSDEILESLEDDADDPEMVSQKLDKGAAIKRCMASLSRDHRVILELIYYHEKSIEEVAEILDIPKNTVKTRTFHARKQLSEKMTAQGLDRGWP